LLHEVAAGAVRRRDRPREGRGLHPRRGVTRAAPGRPTQRGPGRYAVRGLVRVQGNTSTCPRHRDRPRPPGAPRARGGIAAVTAPRHPAAPPVSPHFATCPGFTALCNTRRFHRTLEHGSGFTPPCNRCGPAALRSSSRPCSPCCEARAVLQTAVKVVR